MSLPEAIEIANFDFPLNLYFFTDFTFAQRALCAAAILALAAMLSTGLVNILSFALHVPFSCLGPINSEPPRTGETGALRRAATARETANTGGVDDEWSGPSR
jgi:hypothetical protein